MGNFVSRGDPVLVLSVQSLPPCRDHRPWHPPGGVSPQIILKTPRKTPQKNIHPPRSITLFEIRGAESGRKSY